MVTIRQLMKQPPMENKVAAYKAPVPNSRGLGDTIARATSAVGIKPCGGCKQRQALLNRLVPYRRQG